VATENTQPAASVERTVSLQRSLYDPGYVNAMSHFYRGELGRIMVWRQRLDITTNWAITSSTAIITIAFSNSAVPHIIFFFNLAIVWGMLWIEARRYRFYDAFRARVRMLEAHFLVPMVMENRDLLQGEWKKLVCEDLILPCFKITRPGDRAALETQLRLHFHSIMVVSDENFLHAPRAIDSVPSFYRALRVDIFLLADRLHLCRNTRERVGIAISSAEKQPANCDSARTLRSGGYECRPERSRGPRCELDQGDGILRCAALRSE
jgi:hypothetical protein